jgi:hypothetical protein
MNLPDLKGGCYSRLLPGLSARQVHIKRLDS